MTAPQPPDEQRRRQLEALQQYVANLGRAGDEPGPGQPRRVSWAWALLALLVLAAALLFGVLSGRAVRQPRSPAATPAGGTPTAVVMGDSLSTVTAPAGRGIAFPMVAARLLGWRVTVDAVAGSGFATPGGHGRRPSFASRVRAAADDAPGVVVVALGSDDADAGASAREVRSQAAAGLQDLRRRRPATRIVVVGPLPTSGTPSTAQQAVRDAVQAAARSVGAAFVDPIAEQWITGDVSDAASGNAAQMLDSDGRHLTPSGHAYVGLRLATDISQLTPPAAP